MRMIGGRTHQQGSQSPAAAVRANRKGEDFRFVRSSAHDDEPVFAREGEGSRRLENFAQRTFCPRDNEGFGMELCKPCEIAFLGNEGEVHRRSGSLASGGRK